jgi:two-component system, OmpR family, response regulator CpxR
MARRCRVLVIEDNEKVSALLDDVISLEGYDVELVRPPLDGTDDIDFKRYDVAIIDLWLPRGYDAFAIAQRAAAAGTGIILMSGNEALYERASQSGYSFLQKPFRIASLVQLIHQVLERTGTDCERSKVAIA